MYSPMVFQTLERMDKGTVWLRGQVSAIESTARSLFYERHTVRFSSRIGWVSQAHSESRYGLEYRANDFLFASYAFDKGEKICP